MRILYIHQLFRTPEEGGGIRSWYLAKALVEAGHQVDLISSHQSINGIQTVDGIQVHYLRIPYNNSYGFLKRLWAYGQFVLKARSKAKQLKKPELGYVMTTPLTTGWIAIWLKKKLKIPYFFEVGDLWPDVPIEMGVIKNSRLKKWLYQKEKQFYDEAEKVIVMSPPQRENVQQKTNTPVELIPNMSDTDYYQPAFRSPEISTVQPLRVLYCGAHGQANHLEFLIEAAQKSVDLPIHFTLMGDGSEKVRIRELASRLNNVRFKPHGNKEVVREEMKESDAIFLSFQNLKTLHTGCPNKFFDSLAAGKMVISNLSGWTADLIDNHQIGFHYNPNDPSDFRLKVQPYLNKSKIADAQSNAAQLAREYSRERLSKRLLDSIENR